MSAPRRLWSGSVVQLGSLISVNFGSAVAGLLIPAVGVVPVVAARQLVTVATLVPFWRPTRAGLSWRRLWPAVVLGLALVGMNLTFYLAVHLLGLGIAAVLEYLGPFALAVLGSRRLVDGLCAVAAAAGVVLLSEASGHLNPLGVVCALLAAAFWAAYILFSRRVALALPGLEGITVASIVTTVLSVPVALATIAWQQVSVREWLLLLALGVLSSAVPYSLDAFVLRRLTPRIYAVVTAFGPAVAAVFGWLVLHERFTLSMIAGIALVVASASVAILSHREPDSQPRTMPQQAGPA
ncbi:EamA family transporter [Gryllotalpicola protaetiae]|uniref:EamA family transporter n=1 Tax=Gryllotalpicola protaetiae TaxID=2419771 RepID=A0A387BX62_9MICO|nr:EamA family transporter [Gryllotalpicola protaetiae]AYG05489.1 EamA family transporter [Gryllotalpicola protaetiae]